MRRHYSRLESVEAKRNLTKAIRFFLLTIISIGFFAYFGIFITTKIAGFFVNINKSGQAIDKSDTIPPPPPTFDNLPDATNKSSIEISGNSEEGSTVVISLNSTKIEALTDNRGVFTTKINLTKGQNSLSALARDKSGNISQNTPVFQIVYDNEIPVIEISSPSIGANFYGKKQQTVKIAGRTEPDADLTINDRIVLVNDDGIFSYDYQLNQGENNLNFKAVDKAGNENQSSLKLYFTP